MKGHDSIRGSGPLTIAQPWEAAVFEGRDQCILTSPLTYLFYFYVNLRIYTLHLKNLGHTCLYIYIHNYVCMYVCMYIYISLHTHTSICIGPVDTHSHATYYLPQTRGRCVSLHRVNDWLLYMTQLSSKALRGSIMTNINKKVCSWLSFDTILKNKK